SFLAYYECVTHMMASKKSEMLFIYHSQGNGRPFFQTALRVAAQLRYGPVGRKMPMKFQKEINDDAGK
ncbi:MAG TPA: hypothetical protein VFG02_03395, partial [Nitrospirota bacterium]|nr:hypothetical protein [Nitrospirota bacterium]